MRGKDFENRKLNVKTNKPYAKPTLTRYGNVSKLTAGGTLGSGDGVAGMQPKVCL